MLCIVQHDAVMKVDHSSLKFLIHQQQQPLNTSSMVCTWLSVSLLLMDIGLLSQLTGLLTTVLSHILWRRNCSSHQLMSGETQTMSIVESCPLTKLNGGLSRLHSADEDAVSWLTSYGSWHTYEKKKITRWHTLLQFMNYCISISVKLYYLL